MNCKNCIHYDACSFHFNLQEYPPTECTLFKDKSSIVELPMKVTDRLKEELTKYCFKRCVDEL